MRTAFMYTTARILLFAVSVMVLYFAGARGLLLLGLALVVSALGSYILLNKQRQVLAGKLNNRVARTTAKASGRVAEFRERLEEGSRAEDAERAEDASVTPGDEDDAAAEPAGAAGPAADEAVR